MTHAVPRGDWLARREGFEPSTLRSEVVGQGCFGVHVSAGHVSFLNLAAGDPGEIGLSTIPPLHAAVR